ncbi:MAG: MBL fold hydrolase [Planctomycetaceae bacterium]|nr:MBL fold hydrolase [Planctomycetaceae bacterium]
MKLQFLGAARQVTGSCYLLEAAGTKILIDCGLFQERAFQSRNWDPFPINPRELDVVLLTHAHLDHVGLIPKLVREGFSGRILATSSTRDLANIVMLDAGRIQVEDAKYKAKRHRREGRKGPHPEKALYDVKDAEQAGTRFDTVPFDEPVQISDAISARWSHAGHILGSGSIQITVTENGKAKRIVFSGDIGQHDKPLIRDPDAVDAADVLIIESTYGNRDHETRSDVETELARVINDAVEAGGNVIVPTFAIERAQELLYHFDQLLSQKRIPPVMVYLDSPMAIRVTDVFDRHRPELDKTTRDMLAAGKDPLEFPTLQMTRTATQSKAINLIRSTCVILAGSGMCTGGRVKHHLVQNIERPETTVLFVGYQAHHTLGRIILDGTKRIRIHGKEYDMQAKVAQLHGLSAHADRQGLLDWLDAIDTKPRQVYLTHGEEEAANHLAARIRKQFDCDVDVPQYRQTVEL